MRYLLNFIDRFIHEQTFLQRVIDGKKKEIVFYLRFRVYPAGI